MRKQFSKINNEAVKGRILKQLAKIKERPEIGKPMRYDRKGSRELYIPPYRLAYNYSEKEGIVRIVALYHKDEQ